MSQKFDISKMKTLDQVIADYAASDPNFLVGLEAARIETRREVAASIAKIRKTRKLSQDELAMLIDLSQSRVAQIENGQHSPTLDTLVMLSRSLETRIVIEPDGTLKMQPSKKRKAA